MLAPLARVLLFTLFSTSAVSGEQWSRYNGQGVSIDLPTGSFEVTSQQTERLILNDRKRDALLEVMVGELQGRSTSQFRDLVENADPSRIVTYRAGGRHWFVLAGYLPGDGNSGQLIYYAKFLVTPEKDAFAGFEIIYPRNRKEAFDRVVSQLERTLSLR